MHPGVSPKEAERPPQEGARRRRFEGVQEGRAQNELLSEHVDRIYQWYAGHKDVAGVARWSPLDEIQQKDWNLNISRYIEPVVEAETLTVDGRAD